MIHSTRVDFTLYDESGLFWLAPEHLGGHLLHEYVAFILGGGDALTPLLERGLCVPIGMYGDGGGMNMRLVHRELSQSEAAEWTARSGWKLDLSCGKMLVGCSADPDLYVRHLPPKNVRRLDKAESICYIEVTPGEYVVTVYSYPPKDLSGTWDSIVKPGSWALSHPEAEPLKDYFVRTRPGHEPPYWIAYELREVDYQTYEEQMRKNPLLDFVIQLAPLKENLQSIKLNPAGQTLEWEKRKPKLCPLGIPMHRD